MTTEYTYSKTSDFGDNLDSSHLHETIANEPSINSGNIIYVNLGGDDVVIGFDNVLTEGEITIMETIISEHVPPVYPELQPTSIDEHGNVLSFDGTSWSTKVINMDYQYAENLDESATNSSDFITKLNLTTTNLSAGTYRIGWNYTWSGSSKHVEFIARIIIDDTTIFGEHRELSSKEGIDQKHMIHGFKSISLTEGIHTIKLQYGCDSTKKNTISYISNSKIELMRVG